ncbi:MAG TPA: prephenate dehydrogenase/arogenate dehydrogenase family protein [Candidatus Thiothrix moscowensis]|uniref:prephenate dehydrogenase n=1 Tax=unclassified Thiothrix TaxID=2636184 RepID=UPI0025D70951|nr:MULTISPECIES: prephenate dehydrogenase/arogenate dehydrogenase family protein [unclassified Thiothrix]HRJ53552.1 prephenate dehydrogenase/arogenate dehydrogenase family protein [Candidatus Thiothrix moscowensis]HRJ93640.1 prephenate dehydrogenase/arogenate dehydrogenase family protein [Candidatus Thiothrix moscowensis]
MIKKLVIFGVGLIGGSLALALRQAHYCQQIVGCSRNAEHLQKAVDLGVIDSFTLDPQDAVHDADMVLLAVPMGAMGKLLQQIKPVLPADAILTDAGSTKGSVVAEVEQVFGKDFTRFVPGHPIAGREKSGVEAAIPDLYIKRRVILTPLPHTDADALASVAAMWQVTGAVLEQMPVELHDQVLAATSHLPHVLAFSLVDTLLNLPMREDIFRYAAGGFRDFTRIASSDPVMWRDICLTNKTAIVDMISKLQADLSEFAALMEQQDGDALYERMSRAKQARDSYMAYLENGKPA